VGENRGSKNPTTQHMGTVGLGSGRCWTRDRPAARERGPFAPVQCVHRDDGLAVAMAGSPEDRRVSPSSAVARRADHCCALTPVLLARRPGVLDHQPGAGACMLAGADSGVGYVGDGPP
jgi:hypothetical protein